MSKQSKVKKWWKKHGQFWGILLALWVGGFMVGIGIAKYYYQSHPNIEYVEVEVIPYWVEYPPSIKLVKCRPVIDTTYREHTEYGDYKVWYTFNGKDSVITVENAYHVSAVVFPSVRGFVVPHNDTTVLGRTPIFPNADSITQDKTIEILTIIDTNWVAIEDD